MKEDKAIGPFGKIAEHPAVALHHDLVKSREYRRKEL